MGPATWRLYLFHNVVDCVRHCRKDGTAKSFGGFPHRKRMGTEYGIGVGDWFGIAGVDRGERHVACLPGRESAQLRVQPKGQLGHISACGSRCRDPLRRPLVQAKQKVGFRNDLAWDSVIQAHDGFARSARTFGLRGPVVNTRGAMAALSSGVYCPFPTLTSVPVRMGSGPRKRYAHSSVIQSMRASATIRRWWTTRRGSGLRRGRYARTDRSNG